MLVNPTSQSTVLYDHLCDYSNSHNTGSQLQDRVAALEAEKATVLARASSAASEASKAPAARDAPDNHASDDTAVARLRLDLAEVLRSQGQLQSRLKNAEEELNMLRTKTKSDSRTIRTLTSERNSLATKVRDRDEELRGKSKLVENVQDELIALNLQLNMAEQQKAKVQAENKELVDRWMTRMGQEAEAMNLANEPIFTKGR